jgi:L-alanine-DL-glutamate epimerase-like enolase superfamily enzyme
LKITYQTYDLTLRHTFTISRGSSDVVTVLVVQLEHDGIVAYGETSPYGFYGQDLESVKRGIESIKPWFEQQDPMEYRLVLEEAGRRLGKNTQALCALDLALHDWVGKRLGVPVYHLFGLRATGIPPTTYTIGIDTIEKMTEKLREFPGFPIYKIKLGTDRDIDIVRALRKVTDAVFRVDANCAWTPSQTIENSRELAKLNVEYIEQPMPPQRLDEMADVFSRSALPLVADENSVVPEDVPNLRGRFHGINIKLVKCGGLQPALRMIALARTFGMKIMIGCMIESSNLCTAAAHLGSLVDYLDLDGPLLIGNDPFEGMKIDRGTITLPAAAGLGVSPKK